MAMLSLIAWTPDQVRVFRREVLRENCAAFAAHWTQENGNGISPRTVEGWEGGQLPRRPSHYIRAQLSSAFRGLAAHKKNRHLWTILPPNDDDVAG